MLQDLNYNNDQHKELIYKILKDPYISTYLGKGGIVDLITLKAIKKYVLVIENNCVGLGFIVPLKDKEVEIRYCILSEFRGKKYANLLVQRLLELIEPGYTVYADIQPENNASKKAVLNNGFTTEDDFVFQIKR